MLVVEYYLWRAIMQSPEFHNIKMKLVLVTEAPLGADLAGGFRWEDFKRKGAPDFIMRQREDEACIVYSSGTGGRPKGCVLTHENYLEQCRALTAWYPFWPGVRYLSILPTNHAIDFMVGFIGPFVCGACVVHLRTLRPEFVRDAFVRYRITYVALVPMIVKNLERGLRAKFDELPAWKRAILNRMIGINKMITRTRPWVKVSRRLLPQVHQAFGGQLLAVFTGGAFMEPSTSQFFYDLGIPVVNGYGLTEAGTAFLGSFGLDLRPSARHRRVLCRPCLDWSERRPHLAGRAGAALAELAFQRDWIRRRPQGRSVEITDTGLDAFRSVLGVRI